MGNYLWRLSKILYIWYITKIDQTMKEYPRNLSVDLLVDVPLRPFLWSPFMKEAKNFMGKMFCQFVMLLAGGISAFHYHKVIEIVGELSFQQFVKKTYTDQALTMKLMNCQL